MCSPDEGPRRTETSHFFIKSLELKCHTYIFLLFVLLYSSTQDAYLFVTIYFIYICVHMHTYIAIHITCLMMYEIQRIGL